MLKLALICGGPSPERGISMNSARSVLDHLAQTDVQIMPLYVDEKKRFYKILPSQLYSNTPSDFDFKLAHVATPLTQDEVKSFLQNADLAFPVIHGEFGEDGEIQRMFEQWNIPYVGASADACQRMFYKNNAQRELARLGMDTLPHASFNASNATIALKDFFRQHELSRAVVKPVAGGSSIGVSSVTNADEAIAAAKRLFDRTHGMEAMIEPFCEGREFTVVIIQNENGEPVALLPSEIEVSYAGGAIFDFRRKYLPTSQATYHCPPRFPADVIRKIRAQAEQIFMHFGARDFVRLDGWWLNDGRLLFTDLNPISGMEQNSFLFQQAARVGLSHRQVLSRVLASACKRYGKKLSTRIEHDNEQRPVNVICGGATAERQVSLMSGTNVWLKLRQSHDYVPALYLLALDNQTVWQVPYSYALSHTVEEVLQNCRNASDIAVRAKDLLPDIAQRLPLHAENLATAEEQPRQMTLSDFIELSAKQNAFVFLGLHGGIGEDGTLQRRIGNAGLYNGSSPEGAALCMDKFRTGEAIRAMNDVNIITAPKHQLSRDQLQKMSTADFEKLWHDLTTAYQARHLIMKPQSDGCSAGVVRLTSADDLATYAKYVLSNADHIPAGVLPEQHGIIELGAQQIDDFMLETFIETDKILIKDNELHHTPVTGWLELTVGVLEQNDRYHSLSPSITVAEGSVLSLEEKFQGGTGINITPPPPELFSDAQIAQIKHDIEKTAAALKIGNYARIDIFFNTRTNQMLVIEANSLPGLTPSTVIYHQALAEPNPVYPREFLELLIKLKSHSVILQQQVAA